MPTGGKGFLSTINDTRTSHEIYLFLKNDVGVSNILHMHETKINIYYMVIALFLAWNLDEGTEKSLIVVHNIRRHAVPSFATFAWPTLSRLHDRIYEIISTKSYICTSIKIAFILFFEWINLFDFFTNGV